MGHGTGHKCIGIKQLDQAHNLQSVVMLMGCSSAKLMSTEMINGRRKSLKGISLDYLTSDA